MLPWPITIHVDINTTGAVSLTQTEFENLKLIHSEDVGTNISLTVGAASHEVTDSGNLLSPDVVSSVDSQTITLDVQAVTDPIDLKINGGISHSVTFNEDIRHWICRPYWRRALVIMMARKAIAMKLPVYPLVWLVNVGGQSVTANGLDPVSINFIGNNPSVTLTPLRAL